MDDGEHNPEHLIRDIIRFLEKEQEVYGNFSVASGTVSRLTDGASGTRPETGTSGESGERNSDDAPSNAGANRKPASERIGDCTSLEALRALCEEADELKTDLDGTNLVFGVGNPDADLMLIGEAPGAEEDRQGEPFVGAAGQLLNKILAAIGFAREDVYIANILKHRPPNNRNPNEEERTKSLPFLQKQIDLVDPKLILSLGKVSAQTLLGSNDTLGSMRGKFHTFRDTRELLATYHPAALLRHADWKRPTWEDVQMLRARYDELGCKPEGSHVDSESD